MKAPELMIHTTLVSDEALVALLGYYREQLGSPDRADDDPPEDPPTNSRRGAMMAAARIAAGEAWLRGLIKEA